MPTIERSNVIGGAVVPEPAKPPGFGPFIVDGTPQPGHLRGEAERGALLIDQRNGRLFQNIGTAKAPWWAQMEMTSRIIG